MAILRSLSLVALVVLLTALSVTLSRHDVSVAESGAQADPVGAAACGQPAARPGSSGLLVRPATAEAPVHSSQPRRS